MSRVLLLLVVFLPLHLQATEPVRVTFNEADARLRRVYSLAQETNDSNLVERVLELRDAVRRAFTRKDLAGAERLIRDAEAAVGLDPGGKTMLGLPVARLGPDRRKDLDELEGRLAKAMAGDDRDAVTAQTSTIARLWGDDAGLPDVRREGDSDKPHGFKPREIVDLYLKVVEADPALLKALSAGVPGPETMPRQYASIVLGCLAIRPAVEEHRRDKLLLVDDLIRGCLKVMLTLQLEPGYFRTPDLRGKHLFHGEAIELLVERNSDAVRDRWVVVADSRVGTHLDAAECGIALLRAGAQLKNEEWSRAGRKAADWSLAQPCVPTFHDNAASVSLLAQAFRTTGEKKYVDAAGKKFAVGLAPGQSAGGRWIDPRSARTPNHLLIVRALNDLEEALPAGKDRDRVIDANRRAIQSLVDEADKLGAPATSCTAQELSRFLAAHPDADKRVRAILDQAAAAVARRAGGRVRTPVPLTELSALIR